MDKKIPSTYKELERYTKLKKYQKYEEYPDEIVRDFIDSLKESIKDDQTFSIGNKNLIKPAMKIKESLKVSLKSLLNSKNEIYQALIQADSIFNMETSMNQTTFLSVLTNNQSKEFNIPLQEALGITEYEEGINDK